MNYKEIGKRIMLLRKNIGLSQEYVAQKVKIPRTSLVQIEKGNRGLDFLELLSISKVLGFNINEILEDNFKVLTDEKSVTKDRAENVLLYILEKCAGQPNVGETVLYKLLYFTDFNYYELKKRSLTGLSYKKLPYGPVPVNIGSILKSMIEEEKLKLIVTDYHGFSQKRYIPLMNAKKGKLTRMERSVIDNVIFTLSDMTATRISEYSHNDVPWKVSKEMEIIDYELVKKRKPPYKMKGRNI